MTSRLVVTPNWLGDCVMALPVLRAMRRAHPRDSLAVLAPRGPAGLFRSEGSADTVLVRSDLLSDAWRLRRTGFREAWLLPNSFRSAVAPPIVLPGGAVKPAIYATTGFDISASM